MSELCCGCLKIFLVDVVVMLMIIEQPVEKENSKLLSEEKFREE